MDKSPRINRRGRKLARTRDYHKTRKENYGVTDTLQLWFFSQLIYEHRYTGQGREVIMFWLVLEENLLAVGVSLDKCLKSTKSVR